MRYLSVIALVVILGGLLLWVGLSDSDSTAAEGDALLLAGGPLAATATASPVPTCIAEPVLAASVDFGKSSKTVLDPCTLEVDNGKLIVSAGQVHKLQDLSEQLRKRQRCRSAIGD
jgi:hypothetical protein